MRRVLPVLALVLVASALYANTLLNGFVDDDEFQVLRNPWIQDVRRLPEVFSRDVWGFAAPEGGPPYYRPLMHVAYMAAYALFGLRAWGFHLVNVALHAVCTVLVFRLGCRLAGTTRSDGTAASTAFGAALLFAAHPAHTEAVAWIASLPDLGMTSCYLAAILWHEDAGPSPSHRHLRSAGAFLAALLFKETAVTLPLALGAWDFRRHAGRGARGVLGVYAFYAAAIAVYLVLRWNALPSPFAAASGTLGTGGMGPILNALALYAEYLETLVAPVSLSFWHTFQVVVSPLSAPGLLAIALAAATGTCLVLSFRNDRAIFFALAAGVIPLIPVLNAAGLPGKPFAERYLYLPSAGFILAGVLALRRVTGGRKWRVWAVLAPLVLLCCRATVQRNAVWRDPVTLFSDTVRKEPGVPILRYQLAVALQGAGRIDEAIAQYRTLIEAEPRVARYRASLGDALMVHGDLDEAISQLEAAVALDPRLREAHNDLGTALQAKGRLRDAVEAYRRALAIDSGYAGAHFNLGSALAGSGSLAEAMAHLEEAVRLDPRNAHYHNVLGAEYAKQGRMKNAVEQFEEAVRLAPAESGYRRNLDNARSGIAP